MSTVLWTNSLADGKVASDQYDKPLLLRYADELSRLQTNDGKRFSDYIDGTEAKAIATDDYEGFEDGWELIKHRAKWHSPKDGLFLIRYIATELASKADDIGIPKNKIEPIKEELSQCLNYLEEIQAREGTFNFAIVM